MKEHDVVRVIHEVKYDGNPDGGTEDENEFLTIPIGTQGTNVADYEDACEVEFQSLPTCFGGKGIFVLLIKKLDLEVAHAY